MGAVVAAVVLASVPIIDGEEYVAEALVIVGLGAAVFGVLRGSADQGAHAPPSLLRQDRPVLLHERWSVAGACVQGEDPK